MTETSIGDLFLAGVVPGLLISILFAAIVLLMVRFSPGSGGYPAVEQPSWADRFLSLLYVLPVIALFGFLLTGLYMGIFTPTEGSVIGVVAVLVFGLAAGKLNPGAIRDSLIDASLLSTMLYLIIVGGTLFTRFLVQTGFVAGLTDWILAMNLGYFEFIIAVTLLYLMLGCVLDLFGMLILTVPVLFPTAMALGIDPVWFGIYIIIVAEIGLVTPPIGVNVYIIKTVAQDVPLGKIFLGCLPFVIGMLCFVAMLAVFPEIALFVVR